MFGWDDALAGATSLIGSGLSAFGQSQANQQNAAQNLLNLQANSAFGEVQRGWASGEAQRARDFTAAQTGQAISENRATMSDARNFSREMTYGDRAFAAGQQTSAQDFNSREAAAARDFNAAQQAAAMGFNRAEAQANREFQQLMSSSAYQRTMEDMRSAGLNPILAYKQGGASSPSGQGASVGSVSGPSASVGAAGSHAGGGPALGAPSGSTSMASSGGSHAGGSVPMGNILNNIGASAAEMIRLNTELPLKRATTSNVEQTTETGKATEKLIDQQRQSEFNRTQILAHEKDVKGREAEKGRQDEEFLTSKIGQWSRWLGNIGRELNPFGQSAKGVAGAVGSGAGAAKTFNQMYKGH